MNAEEAIPHKRLRAMIEVINHGLERAEEAERLLADAQEALRSAERENTALRNRLSSGESACL